MNFSSIYAGSRYLQALKAKGDDFGMLQEIEIVLFGSFMCQLYIFSKHR
jgi:hypothetical protein